MIRLEMSEAAAARLWNVLTKLPEPEREYLHDVEVMLMEALSAYLAPPPDEIATATQDERDTRRNEKDTQGSRGFDVDF